MGIIERQMVNNPLILRAHIAELEELRDDLLSKAKNGHAASREMVTRLHQEAMEKRGKLRGNSNTQI